MPDTSHPFVSRAEAAFIADLSDRDLSVAIDERIIPDWLIQPGSTPRISPLAAPLLSFYFSTAEIFTAVLRERVVSMMADRVADRIRSDSDPKADAIFQNSEDNTLTFIELKTKAVEMSIDLKPYFKAVAEQAHKLEQALNLIEVNEEVMGGLPVFRGTRVPIEVVLSSLDEGLDFSRIQASYPFLTEELLEAARIYARTHPCRTRSRREDENSGWILKSSKVVRVASK